MRLLAVWQAALNRHLTTYVRYQRTVGHTMAISDSPQKKNHNASA